MRKNCTLLGLRELTLVSEKAANTPPAGTGKASRIVFSILTLLFLSVGQMWATDPVQIASGTFDGKNETYTTGWSTNGTGKGRNDCIVIGSGENITSPSINLSQYESITISIKARRYGSLTGSKATIAVTFGGESIGSVDATGTNATTALTDIEYTVVSATSKTSTFVFTCSNATSAGSTHGAGINSITITGVAKSGGGGCDKKVTVNTGTPSNGSFTLDKTGEQDCCEALTVTVSNITPAAGYQFSAITQSGIASGVTINQAAKTVTYAANSTGTSTINVTFTELPKYTVSFSTGTGNPSVASQTETVGGAGITLPAGPTPACSADDWEFAGWAAAAVASQTTTAPTLLAAGANYKPAANCTLYAVYKRTQAGGSTEWKYVKIETTSISDKDTVVITYILDEVYYALPNNGGTSSAANVSEVTVISNALSAMPATTLKWDVAVAEGVNGAKDTLTFYPKGTTASWLYCINNNDGLRQGTGADNKFVLDSTYNKDNNPNKNFYLKNVGQSRWVGIYTPNSGSKNFRSYTSINSNIKLQELAFFKATEVETSTTYYLSTPTCCTKHAITISNSIAHGSVEADLEEACEGTVVTLTPSADPAYHFEAWSVTYNDGTEKTVTVTSNQFTMPDYAVTVSATFEHDDCTQLGTPASIAASNNTYPYDAVQIGWGTVEHADKYKVYIYTNADEEIEHNDAVATNSYTISATLAASTTYKVTVQAISNSPADYCESAVANTTFATEALPTATLTLKDNNGTHAASGAHAITVPFNLPTTAATCYGKVLVGWDADENCTSAPTYAKGASFTFTNTTDVTLHAAYAEVTGYGASSNYEIGGLTYSSGETVATGYTLTTNKTSAKTGFVQDSGTKDADVVSFLIKVTNTATQIIAQQPASIVINAHLGAGANRDELTYPVYAVLVDATGANVGDPVVLTDSIPDKDGGDFSANMPTANYANVRGYKVYHMKEDGWNVRYYSMSLTYSVQGAPIYANYSTTCEAPAIGGEDLTDVGAVTTAIETFLTNNNGQVVEELIIDRPMQRNTYYSTLCLPFSLDADALAETTNPLHGFTIKEFTSATVEGGFLNLVFNDVDEIVAGKPYLVKYEAETDVLNQMDFSNVTIHNDLEPVNGGYLVFKGTYAPFEMNPATTEYLFLGAENKLHWPSDIGYIKPFRAYFYLNNPQASTVIRRGMPARIVEHQNITTDVENVQGDKVQCTKVLRDGQLYLMYNGRMYDVRGQIVK